MRDVRILEQNYIKRIDVNEIVDNDLHTIKAVLGEIESPFRPLTVKGAVVQSTTLSPDETNDGYTKGCVVNGVRYICKSYPFDKILARTTDGAFETRIDFKEPTIQSKSDPGVDKTLKQKQVFNLFESAVFDLIAQYRGSGEIWGKPLVVSDFKRYTRLHYQLAHYGINPDQIAIKIERFLENKDGSTEVFDVSYLDLAYGSSDKKIKYNLTFIADFDRGIFYKKDLNIEIRTITMLEEFLNLFLGGYRCPNPVIVKTGDPYIFEEHYYLPRWPIKTDGSLDLAKMGSLNDFIGYSHFEYFKNIQTDRLWEGDFTGHPDENTIDEDLKENKLVMAIGRLIHPQGSNSIHIDEIELPAHYDLTEAEVLNSTLCTPPPKGATVHTAELLYNGYHLRIYEEDHNSRKYVFKRDRIDRPYLDDLKMTKCHYTLPSQINTLKRHYGFKKILLKCSSGVDLSHLTMDRSGRAFMFLMIPTLDAYLGYMFLPHYTEKAGIINPEFSSYQGIDFTPPDIGRTVYHPIGFDDVSVNKIDIAEHIYQTIDGEYHRKEPDFYRRGISDQYARDRELPAGLNYYGGRCHRPYVIRNVGENHVHPRVVDVLSAISGIDTTSISQHSSAEITVSDCYYFRYNGRKKLYPTYHDITYWEISLSKTEDTKWLAPGGDRVTMAVDNITLPGVVGSSTPAHIEEWVRDHGLNKDLLEATNCFVREYRYVKAYGI